MAGAAVTPNRWVQLFHMMGAFTWAVIITPFGAVVCLALLTAAALRAERTAFLCVAGSALALPLSVLLGRSAEFGVRRH
jgi:hypothetical protein